MIWRFKSELIILGVLILFAAVYSIIFSGDREIPVFDRRTMAAAASPSPAPVSTVVPLTIASSKGGLNLDELFVLDRLFNDSNIVDKNRTSLRDLIILDQLFNNGALFSR